MSAGPRHLKRPHVAPIATCSATGKEAFKRQAADELARFKRKATGEVLVPYRCRSCTWWHLGHPSGRA